MSDIIPVFLGADLNCYNFARAFHEAYGVESYAYGRYPMAPTKYSKIIHFTTVPDMDNEDTMLRILHEFAAQHKGKRLYLFGCTDDYAAMIIRRKAELTEYIAPGPAADLYGSIQKKAEFYEVCEKFGIPYPDSKILTAPVDAAELTEDKLGFAYPIIVKPSSSVDYWKHPFDTMKKVYTAATPAEAAEIVKSIFSMFLSGKNKRGITLYLNDHGVPCPTAYKQSQGLKYNAPNAQGNPMWSTITIDTILKNRVYVGDMVQGRQRVKSYKIHIQERVPEDEWFIVENTHEAIIDRETFDKAQGLLKRDTRTAPKQKQLYLFSGFLKCADCGRAMSRIASKGIYVYYQCGTYKSLSKNACTMHSIKNTRLEVGVLFAIQQQVHLAVTYSELVSRINAAPLKKSKSNRLEDMIAVKEKELSKIMRYKQALYQDWKDGEITHNDYRHMSEDYEQQAESINTVLRTLREERDQLENGMAAESPFLTAFLKYQNIDKLTRDILIELIDHIKVYEGGNISVKFKYADEFRRMAEYIELNSQLAVG